MRRAIFVLILSLWMVPVLGRTEEVPLALDEAIAIALRQNRGVLLKAEDIKKAKEKIKEARAGLFPAINFTGGWTDTIGLYAKNQGQSSTQFSVKQPLYTGGKVINTIKYSEYGVTIAEAVLDRVKLETILNVEKAFYTLLLANEFAILNKAILDNTNQYLEVLKARYKNGEVSESGLLSIESSRSTVRQAYEASLNQAEASLALLKNLLYLDEGFLVKPDAEFKYELKEIAYDEAFLKAIKTRPEIRQFEAETKAAQKSVEIAKSGSRPNIYASWDYYSRSHIISGATGLSKNWNDYNVIGLTFSWPIFDGWATKAKVEQAIIDLKETQLLKEKTISDIALELKNAYLDLRNAVVEIKAALDQVSLYKDTLSVTEEKYNAGIASSLDLDNASLGYQVSLFNQKQAIYDYIIAKARFDKATGGF